ncbi:DUF3375 family protein [Stutzerimonas kirkiae]|uniref:DUF3375 family protein n=1 Tax=Stutzerimonas kirkiae TaxID=2211392 RepID=UPI0023EA5A6E|nr:DUF3375 family protein [Stutzerimonas kirkiae]
MDHAQLIALRQQHPAWRLLRADNAPLVVAFLERTFVTPNLRSLAQPSLPPGSTICSTTCNAASARTAIRARPAPTWTNGRTTPTAGCASTTRRAATRRISS